MPSIYNMVKSFVKEAVEYLKKDTERCGLCGCLIEHKAKWATASCPDKPKRWESIKVGQGGKKIKLNGQNNTAEAGDEVQPPDTKD
jgi:hypothetical protein